MAGKTFSQRDGLLLKLTDEVGHCGWGEVAPFGQLHRESIEEAAAQLRLAYRNLTELSFAATLDAAMAMIYQCTPERGWYPSLRCGLEFALSNLLAEHLGRLPASLYSDSYQKQVFVNALLTGTTGTLAADVTRLRAEKYPTVKIKVGRQSLHKDIELVRKARESLGSSIELRLDANRTWDFAEARRFGLAVADCRIAFIEEPLRSSDKLPAFYQATGLPFAYDESLYRCSARELQSADGLAALIIKPQVIGGLAVSMEFARFANRCGCQTIVSSVFESSVGLASLANLAAAISDSGSAHGLDTYRWLAQDVCVPPFAAREARIDVAAAHNAAATPHPAKITALEM